MSGMYGVIYPHNLMMKSIHGIVQSKGKLFLNKYPNALVAISVRKLNTNYSGNCVRVRRTSDNAEADIGFTNQLLNTTALLTFGAGSDVRVVKWYDQSGNGNDFYNTYKHEQPGIMTPFGIYLEGGYPIIMSESAVGGMRLISNINALQALPLTMLCVNKIFVLPTNGYNNLAFTITADTIASRYELIATNLGEYAQRRNTDTVNAHLLPSSLYSRTIKSMYYRSSDIIARINGTDTSNTPLTGTAFNTPPKSFAIIGSDISAFNALNGFQELIIYNTDLFSKRAEMETEINQFYSIY